MKRVAQLALVAGLVIGPGQPGITETKPASSSKETLDRLAASAHTHRQDPVEYVVNRTPMTARSATPLRTCRR